MDEKQFKLLMIMLKEISCYLTNLDEKIEKVSKQQADKWKWNREKVLVLRSQK